MAFSHDFDPANGFVALPSDVMDIEMSPGAFRLLVELCRMANRSGECWPSLAQLSDRIGRSKAAISGYITELRDIDLIETMSQTMANGYNYRLKYCVTFWQNWRAQLAQPNIKPVEKKTKRSVQPSERRVNSKNHIYKKQTPDGSTKTSTDETFMLESVFSEWIDLTKATAFPNFNADVPSKLRSQTKEILAKKSPETLSKDEIFSVLASLWLDLQVDLDQSELTKQASILFKRRTTAHSLREFEKTVINLWQSHWHKPPTDMQFDEILRKSALNNREEGMLRMLEQYLKRWEISQNKLHHAGHSHNVGDRQAA